MKPFNTLLCILFAFLILGTVCLIFPKDGIPFFFTTLRFPSLSEMFPKESDKESVEAPKEDPEEAIRRMLEETKKKEFAAYADSLKYYEDFFKNGATRFDLPDNDPTWFDRFFLNLEIASLGDGVVRIIHYGDSQLEEDRISSTIREDLQTMFGGAGPGMLPAVATIPAMTVSHINSGALNRRIIFGDSSLLAMHNRYGPLAQMAEMSGGATITFKKREDRKNQFPHIEGFRQVRILVGKESANFSAALTYDAILENEEGQKEVKKLNAPSPELQKMEKLSVYTFKLPHKASGATLRLSGRAEIYAIAADDTAGVAVDNVAMRGSSGTVFHKIDKKLLAESYEAMNVKLLILQYGGNLVPGMTAATENWTKKIITRQIKVLKEVYPEADILFIGPADMCKQINGKLQSYPGLNRTIKILREIALEEGLAYWDMHRVMGGNQSMISWVKRNPPLGFSDYIHFTRAGANHMGDLFSYSLRMYYDYFKFREAHKIDNKKLNAIQAFSDSLQYSKNDSLSQKDSLEKTVEAP
jgi:lysophospholipase L1-like esterase